MMHIKSVTVKGFKSFKESATVELSSDMNVVVGANGAGKSNFMSAIKFALAPISRSTVGTRQSLRYNGQMTRNHGDPYVEVVFDNHDRRLPTDSDTVTLRRDIGEKKEIVRLNGQMCQDINAWLNAAGLSRPYSTVQQGEITALAVASDQERLKVLKDVAGLSEFDKHMTKCKASLREVEVEHEVMKEKFGRVQERIRQLQQGREKLEKVKALKEEVRSIEYELKRKQHTNESENLRSTTNSIQLRKAEWLQEMKPLNDKLVLLKRSLRDQEIGLSDQEHLLNAKTLQFNILDEELQKFRTEKERHQRKLKEITKLMEDESAGICKDKELQDKHTALKKQLQKLSSELDTLLAQEHCCLDVYELAQEELKWLENSFNRFTRSADTSSRINIIHGELSDVNRRQEQLLDTVKKLEAKLDEKRKKKSDLQQQKDSDLEEIERFKNTIPTLQADHDKIKLALLELKERRNKYLNSQSSLNLELTALSEEIIRLEANLCKIFDKSTMQGAKSMEKVLNELYKDIADGQEIGYYGTVISNIHSQEEFQTAVEVAGKFFLMCHIVKDTTVSSQIMTEFNKQKLPGQVFFIHLDKIQVPPSNSKYALLDVPEDVRAYEPVSRLIDHIQIKAEQEEVKRAVQFVFGRSLLCRNLNIAEDTCRKDKITCVTLDGDKVQRNGLVSGGYRDPRRKALAVYSLWYENKEAIDKVHDRLLSFEKKKYYLDLNVKNEEANKEKTKSKKVRTAEGLEKLRVQLGVHESAIRQLEKEIQKGETDLAVYKSKVDRMQRLQNRLQEEQNPNFENPSSTNPKRFKCLMQEVRAKFKQYQESVKERTNCAKQKSTAEAESESVRQQLLEQQDKLLCKNSWVGKLSRLETYLDNLDPYIVEKTEKWDKVSQDIQKLCKSIADKQATIRKDKENIHELEIRVKSENSVVLRLQEKKKLLEIKLQSLTETLKNPPRHANRYQDINKKDLINKLQEANRKLKKFESSGLDDMALAERVDDISQELEGRDRELLQLQEKLSELTRDLERAREQKFFEYFRKLQVIFAEVFKSVVPEGQAQLLLHGRDFYVDSISEEGEIAEEQFSGVGFRISFLNDSISSTTSNTQQLSGGQKTLAAIALIVAIQKIDPAPIYLFDEIDAALDTAHRDTVATIIDGLSPEVQFICTTLRQEFVHKARAHFMVANRNSVSTILRASREEALQLVRPVISSDSGTASSSSGRGSELDRTLIRRLLNSSYSTSDTFSDNL